MGLKRPLTLIEAAGALRVSPWTLRSWVRARRVPHYRLGRRIVFDREELRAWVDQRRVEATAAPVPPAA